MKIVLSSILNFEQHSQFDYNCIIIYVPRLKMIPLNVEEAIWIEMQ